MLYSFFSMGVKQASVFVPLIFIEHEPHIPSLHDLLNVSVGSTLFFMYMIASNNIGPILFRSTL